jgi:hypothetical protein
MLMARDWAMHPKAAARLSAIQIQQTARMKGEDPDPCKILEKMMSDLKAGRGGNLQYNGGRMATKAGIYRAMKRFSCQRGQKDRG